MDVHEVALAFPSREVEPGDRLEDPWGISTVAIQVVIDRPHVRARHDLHDRPPSARRGGRHRHRELGQGGRRGAQEGDDLLVGSLGKNSPPPPDTCLTLPLRGDLNMGLGGFFACLPSSRERLEQRLGRPQRA